MWLCRDSGKRSELTVVSSLWLWSAATSSWVQADEAFSGRKNCQRPHSYEKNYCVSYFNRVFHQRVTCHFDKTVKTLSLDRKEKVRFWSKWMILLCLICVWVVLINYLYETGLKTVQNMQKIHVIKFMFLSYIKNKTACIYCPLCTGAELDIFAWGGTGVSKVLINRAHTNK